MVRVHILERLYNSHRERFQVRHTYAKQPTTLFDLEGTVRYIVHRDRQLSAVPCFDDVRVNGSKRCVAHDRPFVQIKCCGTILVAHDFVGGAPNTRTNDSTFTHRRRSAKNLEPSVGILLERMVDDPPRVVLHHIAVNTNLKKIHRGGTRDVARPMTPYHVAHGATLIIKRNRKHVQNYTIRRARTHGAHPRA